MRIIHDLDHPCQVTAGSRNGDVYSPMVGEEISHSFPATALICTNPPEEDDNGFYNDEAIYIEGNALFMLHALEQVCALIRWEGQHFVNEGKLHPDWDNMEAYYERRKDMKSKAMIPRTLHEVNIPMGNGWIATEVEHRGDSHVAVVYIEREDITKTKTSAATRFDLEKKVLVHESPDREPPLSISPEAADLLVTSCKRDE